MPRYEVSGIPPEAAALGLSAFMPHYNRLAASGAQAYKSHVHGFPGTARRYAPTQGTQITANINEPTDTTDLALMGTARSQDAPDSWWPNQYWDHPDSVYDRAGGTAQVQVYDPVRPEDTTMIPVPATDLRGVYVARAATLAGGVAGPDSRAGVLRQATQFIRWPRRRTGNGPGTGG